jgi:hypothetical protein
MDRGLLPQLLRHRRRRAARLAVAAALVLGLEACTGGEPTPTGSTGTSATPTGGSLGRREAVAVWPEDTAEDLLVAVGAIEAGSDPWRLDPTQTAVAFADLVLGWSNVETGEPEGEGTVRVEVKNEDGGPGDVVVTLAQIAEPAWSVIGVADAVDPVAPPMSIVDGEAEVVVRVATRGSALVTLGYGLREATRAAASTGTVRVDLGTAPTTGGHLLVLYLDRRGRVVSAFGTPLPAGDTAAG